MRRRLPAKFLLFLLLFLGLWPAPGYGLEATAGGEALRPKAEEECVTCGPLVTDTCLPLEQGKLSLQAFWLVGVTPGTFSPNWRWVGAGGDFVSFAMPFKIIYGLAPRTEVFLVIPYVHNWARKVRTPGRPGLQSSDFGGLGDINLTLKYLLWEETPSFPAVTGLLSTSFPTGHHHGLNPAHLSVDALGAGAYIFTGGFNFFKRRLPLQFYGNLWYSVPTATTNVASVGTVLKNSPGRDFLTANLAAEYVLTPRFSLLLEVYSQWETSRIFAHHPGSSPAVLIGLLPGVEFIFSPRWFSALGVAIDLIGKNNDRKVTPMFTIVYNF